MRLSNWTASATSDEKRLTLGVPVICPTPDAPVRKRAVTQLSANVCFQKGKKRSNSKSNSWFSA